MIRKIVLASLALMLAPPQALAEETADEVVPAITQLRQAVGTWDVVTTFYRDDGSVAGEADGTYTFDWVTEDKILRGQSEIPQFYMRSAILFYHRPGTSEVEMVSVGPDGRLWVMTGPDTTETRETPVVTNPDGSTIKLRFTRFNVSDDRFESRMERSSDGGETWVQGNHQLFIRRSRQDSAALDFLKPLAGSCWKGMFGDGPAYDVMCVEQMAGGFLKSRHTVRGIDGSYSGETIYFADPATGQPRYTYYTSLGAIQHGAIASGDSEVRFKDIVHTARDGSEMRFKGTGSFLPDGRYRATTSQWHDGQWLEPREIVFGKLDCASWAEVERGCG
ncbi:hypothetical protein [Qipengyuania vesicularis]|uniref:hypothetical protein n=1 Tax=Qipengyuania vesicularis TaxID=2867232 RepID=UPI001C873E91|nr:hypothetical protein [Qipengyuania vesicularis]MBX7527389.1 hypothetical protein [Qipengyuania vesicularis]